MNSPFVWGPAGEAMSPERRQMLTQSLMQPIANPIQGWSQMANAAVDAYRSNPLNQFPEAPGGAKPGFGGMFALGSRLFGGGGGLY